MSNTTELLKRALDALDRDCADSWNLDTEIRTYLSTPSDDAEEPVYLARRKGLDDFFTCSKDRYDELSALDLFETKIAFLHPPKPAEPAARKPMTEDEAIELCPFTREEFKAGFLTGIRFAEKHHGISGENQ